MRLRPWMGSLLLLAGALACTAEPAAPPLPPVVECVDADRDGFDSCVDCDDADPAVHPGAAERCNGKDDGCNKVADEGCACRDGDAPRPCGAEGGGCTQACAGGALGACLPPGGAPPDLESDPLNCGECGRACPVPLHAAARCVRGVCGRGPCEAGYFDFDRSLTPGCEVRCEGRACTGEDGATIAVDSAPVPEAGAGLAGPSSGGSYGAKVQTNAAYTNTGVLGAPVAGAAVSTNATHKNYGGFTSAERR